MQTNFLSGSQNSEISQESTHALVVRHHFQSYFWQIIALATKLKSNAIFFSFSLLLQLSRWEDELASNQSEVANDKGSPKVCQRRMYRKKWFCSNLTWDLSIV